MRIFPWRAAFVACALFCLEIPSVRYGGAGGQARRCRGQKQRTKARLTKAQRPDKDALPPLPAEAHVQQSIQLDGKTLKYTVTVGALPVRDKDGKVAGEVVVTSYTMDGDNRPVRLPSTADRARRAFI